MQTKTTKRVHLHIVAVDGAYAYSGEILNDANQSEGKFEGKSLLPRSGKTNQRDTLTAFIAALSHTDSLSAGTIRHITIWTNP